MAWALLVLRFLRCCASSHDAEEINALKYLNVSYQGSVGSNDQVISAYCKCILRSGNSMMYESRQFWTEAFGFSIPVLKQGCGADYQGGDSGLIFLFQNGKER